MDHTRPELTPHSSTQDETPEEIRGHIRHTRDEIGKTMDTIQERLSPDRLKQHVKAAAKEGIESVKENVRDKAHQWQTQVTEKVSNNPIPAAMVGVGLLWLWAEANAHREREYHRRYRNSYPMDSHEDWPVYEPNEASGRVAHPRHSNQGRGESLQSKAQAFGQQTGEQVGQWADQAQESLSEWKSMARHQTSQLKDRARDQGERAMGEFQRQLQDNPLTVGAMTLAIGTAIGLSLPRSQKEDEWLGETRDRLVDQAKATAQEILPKVKQMSDEVQRVIHEQSGVGYTP